MKDYLYWDFPSMIPQSQIDLLLKDSGAWTTRSGQVGDHQHDISIRSVKVKPMPVYHSISLQLMALAYHANQQCWQYELGGPTQSELLTYDEAGDKYEAHVDSLRLSDNMVRKLSVILLLNDQFEGGKFYFQTDGHNRQTVALKPGSVLVFPSHHMHGIEPVTSGQRQSVVSWISGPNFK